MKPLRLFVPLALAVVSVAGVQSTASAAPLTKQNFTLTAPIGQVGGPVVASGAINGTGSDVVISDTMDRFVFTAGTLTIIHAPVRGKEHFNEKKCTGTFRESGAYIISAGTGQYAGVTGSGTYRAAGRFEDGCANTPTGTFTITARGSINLPG